MAKQTADRHLSPEQRSLELAERKALRKGPPRLNLRIKERLTFLLIANVIPLCIGAYIGVGWIQGSVQFQASQGQMALILAGIILVVLIGMTSWLILPTARWLRHYPLWHFRHSGKFTWFIPMCFGAFLCGLLYCLCAAGVIFILLAFFGFFNQPQNAL